MIDTTSIPATGRRPNAAHGHVFLGSGHRRNERRTWLVIAITGTMMVVEIVAGTLFGSMALVADGWHMSTHAAAMLVAALAYRFARRNAHDPRFTFGTGKVGDLAAFASAVMLALVALLIGWESAVRLVNPVEISFSQAIGVAIAGLAVNLVCAFLLKEDHDHHHHGHGHHEHHHDEHHGHRDNNLRAAYLHVVTDALTSVLAIVALLSGRFYGWAWMDPAMGIIGALVIAVWSWGLIRDAGRVLIDFVPSTDGLTRAIEAAVASDKDRIVDLHVWQVGPGHHSAIVSVESAEPKAPSWYREKLAALNGLSHLTVEVEPRRA